MEGDGVLFLAFLTRAVAFTRRVGTRGMNAAARRATFRLALALIGTISVAAQESKDHAKPDESQVEFANPELARLDIFIGPWSVTESHFNPRGELIATVKGTEEITWILDHRAIRRAYSTAPDSTIFKAQGTLTWNNTEKKYRGVWFDNVSTAGPSTVTGGWDDQTRTMLFQLESAGRDGSIVRYRVVERFADPQTRVATTYLIEDGSLVKRMEVEYKRATPCPAKAITIMGG